MRNNHKEWMTTETWKIVEERKQRKGVVNNSRIQAKKAKVQMEHSKANRRVKKSTKEDKHNYLEALAVKAGEAATGETCTLHLTIRKPSGRFK